MTDQEKWAAVCGNDASCDGRFFYAVKTTRIFCRPSCLSKTHWKGAAGMTYVTSI